jgi:hypothetical protein
MEGAIKAEDLKTIESLPPSTLCRRINFEHAQVVPGIVPRSYFLIVSGKKPWASMTVELQALIYIQQPEYWGIEVVGCVSGVSLPVEVPYSVWLDITHVLGKQGIEVIGATKTEKIRVP